MDTLLTFADRLDFRKWLEMNGASSEGVWLLFGKSKNIITLSSAEALEEALCHGWIDGQMKSLGDSSYKKYFAPRLPKSKWSAKNRNLALELIERGLMTKSGTDAIECAKKNGMWDSVQNNKIDDSQIQQFREIVQSYEAAYSNLVAMPHSVQCTYAGFYFEAKTDKTRQSRLEKIVDRLNRGLKPM